MNLYERLLAYETTASNPADGRRIVSGERQTLHVARERVEKLARSKRHVPQCWTQDAEQELTAARAHLTEVEAEARRVLAMWVGA